MSLMIFGAGYSGKAIASAFMGAGFAVSGTTRSAEKAVLLRAAGLSAYLYDGETLSGELRRALSGVTHLVQSVSPGPEGDSLQIGRAHV